MNRVALAVLLPLAGFAATRAVSPGGSRPPLAPTEPAFECRWADSPVVIDGTPDEAAWKHAQVIDSFKPGRHRTTAKLLWDREFLYFAAEADDPDVFADGDLSKTDHLGVFLRPAGDKPGYYEFRASAAGTAVGRFSPKRDGAAAKPNTDGEFRPEVKAKRMKTGWSVEGRISWAEMLRTGGRPEPGESWLVNLVRHDCDKGGKNPEVSSVAASPRQTDGSATLKFVGMEPVAGYAPVTTSTVVGFPDPPPPFRPKRVFDKLRPAFPIMVAAVPGTDQFFALTQTAPYAPSTLVRFREDDGVSDAVKVMDTPHRGVAYDVAFHPKFAANGFFYVGWNGATPGRDGRYTTVTRYTMQTKPPYDVDLKSGTTVIEWKSDGHNGGAVCFGTDGMLYVTSGDGTSDSDTNFTGQRTDLMLAKVLRIDVDRPDGPKPYSVPKDNPFVGNKEFVPETWAYGLRNPWRITCDPKTGHVWVGNNGQDLWEQAYLVKKGDNYGWSVMEGSHPFYPARKAGPTPFVKPTLEHHHSEARSLTGGVVYHGEKLPELKGAYVYGDYSTGRIWAARHDGEKLLWHKEVAATPLKITGFALDHRGELLVCDHAAAGEGGFYTLEPNAVEQDTAFPKTLSASGLFESVKGHVLKPGAIPYSVNAPFWSDGLHKERFVALPPGGKIGFHRDRSFDFPDRTVLVKSFALEQTENDPRSRKWVETRFMTKQGGEWYGYSYLWNDAGTDAALVDAKGLDREFTVRTAAGERKQVWHYPSRAECMVCHSRAANFVLGLCEAQLNREHDYGGGRVDHQLRALERLGVLKVDWAGEVRRGAKPDAKLPAQQPGQREPKPSTLLHQAPEKFKKLANPYDKSQDLTLRARSWLQVNCASCHVEAGGGNAQMNLEFATALEKMKVVDAKPVHATFELPDARLIAPGSPERSVLLHRIGTRGPGQMPPLSTNRVDAAGVELIREWCRSLKP